MAGISDKDGDSGGVAGTGLFADAIERVARAVGSLISPRKLSFGKYPNTSGGCMVRNSDVASYLLLVSHPYNSSQFLFNRYVVEI